MSRLYQVIDQSEHLIHLSSDLRADRYWWSYLLQHWNGIHLLRKVSHREVCHIWTDASGTVGIGGFILDKPGQPPYIDGIFSRLVPTRHKEKDIQFKEMFAVLTALYMFRPAGKLVHIYCDNVAVCWGLYKLFIRGPAMVPLRSIALSYAQQDILTVVRWIPTYENLLADCLSRFELRILLTSTRSWHLLPPGGRIERRCT